jgi:hypothetical protein
MVSRKAMDCHLSLILAHLLEVLSDLSIFESGMSGPGPGQ